jgi:hypothetical protein
LGLHGSFTGDYYYRATHHVLNGQHDNVALTEKGAAFAKICSVFSGVAPEEHLYSPAQVGNKTVGNLRGRPVYQGICHLAVCAHHVAGKLDFFGVVNAERLTITTLISLGCHWGCQAFAGWPM